MSWAQEIKNLVADIKVSHKDRTAKINEIKRDVKDFLKKSETSRIADFKVMMENVTERVGKIRKRVRRVLGEYAAERKEAASYWAGLSKKASSE